MARHRSSRPFKCDICQGSYKTITDLNWHKNRHTKPDKYKCRFCSKPFFDKSKMMNHEESMHIKSGKFRCNICYKCFGSQLNLNLHMKIHLGIKDYICSECGHATTQKYSLVIHHRTVHQKLKLFKCQYCEKSFGQSQDMKNHEKKH